MEQVMGISDGLPLTEDEKRLEQEKRKQDVEKMSKPRKEVTK